jgi:hypothetical protein
MELKQIKTQIAVYGPEEQVCEEACHVGSQDCSTVVLLCRSSNGLQSNAMHCCVCCCLQRSDGSTSPQFENGKELCISPLSQFFCSVGKQSPDIIAVVQLQANITYDEAIHCMQHLTELHDRFRRRVVCRWVDLGTKGIAAQL